MSYFDCHIHPIFKNFVQKYEEIFPTKRVADDLTQPFDPKNILTDIVDEEFLHFLDSQTSYSQMQQGEVRLGIAAIAPVEFAFAASEGFFSQILNSRFLVNPMDVKHLEACREGEVSYYRQFLRELELYIVMMKAGKVEILSRKKHKNVPDNGLPVLALSMEGGHALCRFKTGKQGERDQMPLENGFKPDALIADFNDKAPLTAKESFQRFFKSLWAQDLDILYITLTHLTHIPDQLLANHAYGFKMLKHNDAFPQGFGITQQGKDVIDAAYTTKDEEDNERPVLIDIKHMALKSRLDLYAYRKEKGYDDPDKPIPILASHMGVTGYSVNEWISALDDASFFREKNIDNATTVVKFSTKRKDAGRTGDVVAGGLDYNPWSINLMDEDIVEVLKSKGMIGVSLDIRILGVQNILEKGEKEEFLSREEFRYFFPIKYQQLAANATETFLPEMMREESLAPTKEKKHTIMLCLNMLHIVSTGKLNGINDPWPQVCIGSDFDGLINPVKNCRSVQFFGDLESSIKRWMVKSEEIYMKENGGPELLPRTGGDVDMGKLNKLIRGVMFENGKRFVEEWLK